MDRDADVCQLHQDALVTGFLVPFQENLNGVQHLAVRAVAKGGEGGTQVTTERWQQPAEPIFPDVPTAQSDSTSIQICDPKVRSDRRNDLIRETGEGWAAGGVDNRALKPPRFRPPILA